MRRSVLAGLLIVCWIILSGMDLLEDLNQFQNHGAVASSSAADRGSSKGGRWGTSANNIVESANRASGAGAAFLFFLGVTGGVFPGLEFHAYFSRQKLYRVFLI